jgi:AcrR family transcriptional regulator
MTDDAFSRIAATAARIFLARGYSGVNLRGLAAELGIQAASLYYHCPGGKAELYARSVGMFFDGYRDTLEAARGRARFPETVRRMSDQMLDLGAIDFKRITRADLPNLDDADARALADQLHDALLTPFRDAFEDAKSANLVRQRLDTTLAAACVVSLVDSLGFQHLPVDRAATAEELDAAKQVARAAIALLVDGARR